MIFPASSNHVGQPPNKFPHSHVSLYYIKSSSGETRSHNNTNTGKSCLSLRM